MPELVGQGIEELLDRVYQTGEPLVVSEHEMRLTRNCRTETMYANFSFHPMRNLSGEVEGILVHAVEVTEQVLARNLLEARVKERTADLEKAKERLRALSAKLMQAQDQRRLPFQLKPVA